MKAMELLPLGMKVPAWERIRNIRYAPASPIREPSAAPMSRFRVIFRTWSSKKISARPMITPIAAPTYGDGTPKGRRNQAAQPSSVMKRIGSKNKSFTATPSERVLAHPADVDHTTDTDLIISPKGIE